MNVRLKQIALADASKIAKWKSDPDLAQQIMSSVQATDDDAAREWIKKNTADPDQQLNGIYAEEQGKLKLLGITRLMFIDRESRNAELGIYVGARDYRGLGVGEQALRLTLAAGFGDLGLGKIYLRVAEKNTNAIALYEKLNFRREGILKEHYYVDGRFENIVLMAMFAEQCS